MILIPLIAALVSASTLLPPAQSAPPPAGAAPVFRSAGTYVFDAKAARGGLIELSFDRSAMAFGEDIDRIEGVLKQPGAGRLAFTLSQPDDDRFTASFVNMAPGTWTLRLRAYDRAGHELSIPLTDEETTLAVTPFAVTTRDIALELYGTEFTEHVP
jgi:hypothetical protein